MNHNKKILGSLLLVLCSGCVTSYKDVMQDKSAYLDSTFTVDKANAAAVATIKAKDAQPVGFSKLIVKQIPHVVNASNDLNKIEKENTLTVISRGGPFVAILEDSNANGVLTQSSFILSYRGILNLRYQFVRPGQINASRIMETTDITDFSSALALKPGSDLTYNFIDSPTIQIANFKRYKVTCKAGTPVPASTLFSKLEGDAINLKCQTFDEFGASIDSNERMYLVKYGYALTTKHSTPTYTTEFEITDVQIFR
jgi:hypothetical protein